MLKRKLGTFALVLLAVIGVPLLLQKGNQVRSTIIGFEDLASEGTLTKGLRFNSSDTMGRVCGLDLNLVDVKVGQGATIRLTDLSYHEPELLQAIGYAEHESTEVNLALGASTEFRGYRVSLKSVDQSLLPTGSQKAVVVVHLMEPEDRWFSVLHIGLSKTPLHPKIEHSRDWYGFALAAPKVVLTENRVVGRDDFHGLAPSSARVMIAGTWHLTAADIKAIEKSQHRPADECARIMVVGPGKDDRQELHVAQLLADIGDKQPRHWEPEDESDPDPHANHLTARGGYFTVDIGDKIATKPNATGVFRLWGELGTWKSSELQIELKPQ